MKSRLKFLALLFMLSVFTLPGLAQEVVQELPDMSGKWKILIKNSLSRKQITFNFEQVEGRLRGTYYSRDTGEQKCEGRVEADGTFFIWSKFVDRAGNSTSTEFKGQLEKNKVKGSGEFFEKRYDFVGSRVKPKKKTSGR